MKEYLSVIINADNEEDYREETKKAIEYLRERTGNKGDAIAGIDIVGKNTYRISMEVIKKNKLDI